MASARSRILKSELGDYFKANAKTIVSALVIFVVSVAIGVAVVLAEVDGKFETVARVDAETGAGKVFFASLLTLAGCYALVLLSGANRKTAALSCLPFLLIGFLAGRYSAMLLCRYELFGLLNFFFVYLPVFLASLLLLVVAAVRTLSASCTECAKGSGIKPSVLSLLKLFAVNVAVCFAFFVLIGLAVGGVIVPTPF